MVSELLDMIRSLPGEPFFYVDDGALKSRLIERYLEEDDAHVEILEFELNASVRIKRGVGAAAPSFDCRLEAVDFQYLVNWSVEDLATEEITELLEQLRLLGPPPMNKEGSPGRNIVRKKQGRGLLNISAAATALGLSHRVLKSLVPCSEVRIAEEQGGKTIKEFY